MSSCSTKICRVTRRVLVELVESYIFLWDKIAANKYRLVCTSHLHIRKYPYSSVKISHKGDDNRMHHSLIISGRNTYDAWGLIPTSRPVVDPPEIKATYVDLPASHGVLDYTSLLLAEVPYGQRKGSWEFMLPQARTGLPCTPRSSIIFTGSVIRSFLRTIPPFSTSDGYP